MKADCNDGAAGLGLVDEAFAALNDNAPIRGIPGSSGGGLAMGGSFHIECVSKSGKRRWVRDLKNSLTNQALDNINNVYLGGSTATTSWYLGLVDNASFTAFAAGDLPASHSGWVENTAYSNSTRPQWTPGASSSQSVTNGTAVSFSMNATATIRGIFLISANDKGGGASPQILFSTAAFSGGNQTVNNGDTLKVTYTVSSSTS